MTFWNIIITFIVIVVLAVIINGVEDYGNRNKLSKLSFGESMGRLNFPIVTLTNNGKDFNFLVDTGASVSVVDSKVLDEFEHTKLRDEGNAYGVDGNIVKVDYASIELSTEEITFTKQFQVMRLNAFDNIRETDGLNLHGILGSDFLNAHSSIVDFGQLTLYIREAQDDLSSN